MYFNIFSNENPLFLFTVNIKANQVKFSSHFKTEYLIKNVGCNIFFENKQNAWKWSKFHRDSYVLMGSDLSFEKSSFSCKNIWFAIDKVTYQFLELTSLTGLNIRLGQSNSPQDRVRAVYVWSDGLKIEIWDIQKGL